MQHLFEFTIDLFWFIRSSLYEHPQMFANIYQFHTYFEKKILSLLLNIQHHDSSLSVKKTRK